MTAFSRTILKVAIVAGLIMLSACAHAQVIRKVDVTTNAITYDRYTDTFYATVPSRVGPDGNSIKAINPHTGQVLWHRFIGSEPGYIAASAYGQYVYASLAVGAFARLDLSTKQVDQTVWLGTTTKGPILVEDMQAMPGSPETIAVATRVATGGKPYSRGVRIYDNDVMRPGYVSGPNDIDFSESPDIIYGFDRETVNHTFYTMAVTENGTSTTRTDKTMIRWYNSYFEYADGRVYSGGAVWDVETGYQLGGFYGAGGRWIIPEPSSRRVYFLMQESGATKIKAYNMDTFLIMETLTIPGVHGDANWFHRWGPNGFAFNTNADEVWFVESDELVPEPTTVLALLCGLCGLAYRRKKR